MCVPAVAVQLVGPQRQPPSFSLGLSHRHIPHVALSLARLQYCTNCTFTYLDMPLFITGDTYDYPAIGAVQTVAVHRDTDATRTGHWHPSSKARTWLTISNDVSRKGRKSPKTGRFE